VAHLIDYGKLDILQSTIKVCEKIPATFGIPA
jgi:hypothetical protein